MWCFYHMMLPQRCRIGQFVVCYFCKIIFDQHTWTLKWHISQENLYSSQSWKACDLMIHVKTFMWHVTGEIAVWNHIRILFTTRSKISWSYSDRDALFLSYVWSVAVVVLERSWATVKYAKRWNSSWTDEQREYH